MLSKKIKIIEKQENRKLTFKKITFRIM